MAFCGYRTGVIKDATRPNWQNNAERPIAWSAWYPTEDALSSERPSEPFFRMGEVIPDAGLMSEGILPVLLLSHGTGGTAESIGWLSRKLACAGYVVIGANHHGNTGLEPYLAEGFLCWWERATDLSILLTSIATTGFFADRLDLSQVSAIGFSLGAHTVLALTGAQTSLDEFDAWRNDNNVTDGGPKEFPDAADSIPSLLETSEAFRQSWARHGDDFSDSRITSIVAIAPASPVRSFTAQSIGRLRVPVTILTGGADQEAPAVHCADWLVRQNREFHRYDLGRHVGHYTFLEFPSDISLIGKVDIFSDHEAVERAEVHGNAMKFVFPALK